MTTFANLGRMKAGLTADQIGALMREREAAEARGDQTLRDVYGFVDNSGVGSYAQTPNGITGDAQGWGDTGRSFRQADTQANNGADGNAAQAPVTFDPGRLFQGAVSLVPHAGTNGEGGGGYRYQVHDEKLPQTRFGGVSATAPVTDSTRELLRNPNMVYDDENYGEITHGANIDNTSWSDMVFPAIMAAMMGGMGALAGPGIASSIGFKLPGLAQGFANGSDPWGSLISMLGGQAGIPSWATGLVNTGLNMARRP